MLYDRPIYRPLGDMFVDVEFGDELHLALNFRVIGLNLSLTERPIPGVTETVPSNRALMIAYDSSVIRQAALIDALREREEEATKLRRAPSRLVTIPFWYNDPWSDECARAHGAPNNMDYLAEINHTTVERVIAAHSGTEWWVTSVGFQPGCYQALPLDPTFSISAPKYPRPRQWTPERILCLAGKITSFYPVRSPGGYQLLGRTPVDLYDPQQLNEVFRDSPVLPIAGERHRYLPIGEAEYHDVRRQVELGDYRYDIEEGEYLLDDYLQRLDAAQAGDCLMLDVISGGPQTTVQDLGRPGFLHTGMPPSGAFDSFSLRIANLLAGNSPGGRYLVGRDPGDAGLEVLLMGCRLRATGDHVIAVTGGDLTPTLNDAPLPMWAAVRLRAGDEIAFKAPRLGVRAYLAVTGGIDVPTFLGSRATNVRAAVGGIEGRGLKPGDQLPVGEPKQDLSALEGRTWPEEARPDHATPWKVRVVLGPQDHLFTPESVETFLTADWKLSPISDRMGCRYIGPKLDFLPRPDYLIDQAGSDPSNIVDDGTPLGGIQVPSGLEPIVMGADVPSFGGYAKIATVIGSDIGVVGQGKPGDTVHFRAITVTEAEDIGLAQEQLLTEVGRALG